MMGSRLLKCDRGQPYKTCAHRNLSCTYVPNIVTKATSDMAAGPSLSKMQGVLTEMESLAMTQRRALLAVAPGSLTRPTLWRPPRTPRWPRARIRLPPCCDHLQVQSGPPLPSHPPKSTAMDNIAFYRPQSTAEATKEVVTVPMTLPLARSTSFRPEARPVDDPTPNCNEISAPTGT